MYEGLYSGVETYVVMNGAKSRGLGVERGLRQGCPLSPLLIFILWECEEFEKAQLEDC